MTAATTNALSVSVTKATTLADVTTSLTASWRRDFSISMTKGGSPPEDCIEFNFSVLTPWDNPEDLVTNETQQKFRKFVNVYLLTLLFFIAVPTNIINMIIYCKHGLKERINLCLFCLSLADLVTVASHFVWNLDGLYAEVTGSPRQLVVMKFSVNNMIHSLASFIYISGFLSLLIAFERFLCVVYPLKAHSLLRTRTTLIVIIAASVVILAGLFVIATKWHVVCVFDSLIGQTKDTFISRDFYTNNKFVIDIFDGIVFGILIPGICVVGVLVFTIIIVIKLREMAQWRNQSSGIFNNNKACSNVKDVALTRMLIGTSVLYVVCTVPFLMFHVALPLVPQLSVQGKLYNTYLMLMVLQQLLTYINASVNFFIYFVFGTKFRHSVQRLFGFNRRRQGGSGTRETSATNSQNSGISVVSYSLQNFSDLVDDAGSKTQSRKGD